MSNTHLTLIMVKEIEVFQYTANRISMQVFLDTLFVKHCLVLLTLREADTEQFRICGRHFPTQLPSGI